MNVDYDAMVRATRRLVEGFPELQQDVDDLVDDEEGPQVYTAMTSLARALIDDHRVGRRDRFASLFETVEMLLRNEQYDVRNLVITGLLEDLSNFSMQADIELSEWEEQLGEASLVGWRAVLDLWAGKITGTKYDSILRSG